MKNDYKCTLQNLHIFCDFVGNHPDITPQQIVDEINKGLQQVEEIIKCRATKKEEISDQ